MQSYITKFSVSEFLCMFVGIGSQTMRTTVMKLLQVTQWVSVRSVTKFLFQKYFLRYFGGKIAPDV